MKPNLLLATQISDESVKILSRHSVVFKLEELDDEHLGRLLPTIDCLCVFSWPKQLTGDNLKRMTRLAFVQNILAGVNQVPFAQLGPKVVVTSNAGAYSIEVAEYAFGLLLSAAKRIVQAHTSVKNEPWTFQRTMDTGKNVLILNDKILGILGYGGIGAATGRIGLAFQMRIYGYSRRKQVVRGATIFYGRSGLRNVLANSDMIVLTLPLTVETKGIIDREALNSMKEQAIVVNVARGELVDQEALYKHLENNPSFQYATDVWWYREGRETLKTDYPFMTLPNFTGTPHLSGPSGFATGKPVKIAVENLVRYLRGLRPRNIVDRHDYVSDALSAG